jgi:D-alanyl-D-alanine dipeptidase
MTRIARVPIRECGEVLMDVAASSPVAVAQRTFLRCGVVDRLVVAQSMLPRDVRLLVVDGYRTGDDPAHPTGGAVDLMLSVGGAVELPVPVGGLAATLPMCCGDAVAVPAPPTARLMVTALTAAGLVNSPTRWWHWSYGDRFWAFASGAAQARYGVVPAGSLINDGQCHGEIDPKSPVD